MFEASTYDYYPNLGSSHRMMTYMKGYYISLDAIHLHFHIIYIYIYIQGRGGEIFGSGKQMSLYPLQWKTKPITF